MRQALLLIAVVLASGACGKSESSNAPSIASQPAGDKPVTATKDPCKPAPHGVLPWIADDFAAAKACAQQANKPIVIDLWAPWCHTCLSMQSTVFGDAKLAAQAEHFVFVALDTDRDVNAQALESFPPAAWPTFYVVSPAGDAVLARFVGSASVDQFLAFLDAGRAAQRGGIAGADARLLGAEKAAALKDWKTAEEEYVAALAAAPPTWVRRPDVMTSLLATKYRRGDPAGCVQVAEDALKLSPDPLGNTAAASDFLASAMTCADKLAANGSSGGEPKNGIEAERIQKLREAAVARWAVLLADAGAPLSVDDRSDAMAQQRTALDALGKKDEAKALAEQQRALLDDAAAKAPNPMAAMTYNWPRAEVYVYLNKALELVPALQKSAADLPKEYDPPARLGWIYLRSSMFPEAQRATDAALRLAYGPRKARVLAQRAEIAKALKDAEGEKLFRQEVVKLWESMPPGQANPDALEAARKALAELP